MQPAVDEVFERAAVEGVEPVSALPTRHHQTGVHKDVDVLGERLPGRGDVVLRREPPAKLEQGLLVPFGQLIENRATRGIRESLEDVTHTAR